MTDYTQEAERRAATAYEFFKAGICTARQLDHEVKVREDLGRSHQDLQTRAQASEAEAQRLREALVPAGDQLQSTASRLAEWVRAQDAPYEVAMAAHEAQSAVEKWTEARTLSPEHADPEQKGTSNE